LVATVSDVSTSATWGCAGVQITGADGQAIGDGNQNTINRVAIGGFAADSYWSSSEFTDNNALTKNFSTGSSSQSGKGNTLRVRAIRSF